jgi:membrane protease YdiL (CAAX protease family)|tara:strand:+ start:55858 stop:56736 length:879 start_codon:yes stop_codon:yes gene_type:complete
LELIKYFKIKDPFILDFLLIVLFIVQTLLLNLLGIKLSTIISLNESNFSELIKFLSLCLLSAFVIKFFLSLVHKNQLNTKNVLFLITLIFLISLIKNIFSNEGIKILFEFMMYNGGLVIFILIIISKYDNNVANWLEIKHIFKSKIAKTIRISLSYYFLAWPIILLWGIIIEFFNLNTFNDSNYSKMVVEALNNNYFLIFFLAVIVGPIFEELIFRGYLFKILKIRLNNFYAIALNSIFFGIIHFELSAIIPAVILGISLSLIRLKTNNLIPSTIIHSLHNLFALIVTMQTL